MRQVSNRQLAKQENQTYYFTGKPCKRNHIEKRFTSSGGCVLCVLEYIDKDKIKQYQTRSKLKNPNRRKEITDKYYMSNKEKILERIRIWKKNNKSKVSNQNKKYNQNNKAKILAGTRLYQTRKLNATPKWLTKNQFYQMEMFYIHAKECELLTGDKYDVDHIVPLQGKNVCGLHVPWNLQILPADINRSKYNKFDQLERGATGVTSLPSP